MNIIFNNNILYDNYHIIYYYLLFKVNSTEQNQNNDIFCFTNKMI